MFKFIFHIYFKKARTLFILHLKACMRQKTERKQSHANNIAQNSAKGAHANYSLSKSMRTPKNSAKHSANFSLGSGQKTNAEGRREVRTIDVSLMLSQISCRA